MNIVEQLLKHDAGEISNPTGEFKMKLRKLGGQEFIFPIRALDPEVAADIQEDMMQMTVQKKKMEVSTQMYQGKVRKITEGCPEVFKSKEVIDNFKAKSPHDLIKILLTSGEIDDLVEAIDKLSGYDSDNDDVDEIKN